MKAKHFIVIFVFTFVAVTVCVGAPKQNSKKSIEFSVSMHCQNCVNTIEREISFEKGVKNLEINLDQKTVKITYDTLKTNDAVLKKKIENLGYDVKSINKNYK